jgi:DNA helicase HerA-like ATPase
MFTPAAEVYEKLASFYLGRHFDLESGKLLDDLLMVDARDFCTHALCVGMTGSGKTGLCISLLEEAALDGVPVVCIDPKGDLANLLLTFPELRPEDFAKYIDKEDANSAALARRTRVMGAVARSNQETEGFGRDGDLHAGQHPWNSPDGAEELRRALRGTEAGCRRDRRSHHRIDLGLAGPDGN